MPSFIERIKAAVSNEDYNGVQRVVDEARRVTKQYAQSHRTSLQVQQVEDANAA